jgi:hypothetical protein
MVKDLIEGFNSKNSIRRKHAMDSLPPFHAVDLTGQTVTQDTVVDQAPLFVVLLRGLP